ncbi:MAG: hypothetical protein ABEJ27_00165 [Halodesulfurarchaeum sp.]
MAETIRPSPGPSGTTLRTVGVATVAVALAIAAVSALRGDLVTAGAVLLYLPIGYLLFRIGGSAER